MSLTADARSGCTTNPSARMAAASTSGAVFRTGRGVPATSPDKSPRAASRTWWNFRHQPALTAVVYHHVADRADAFTDKLLVTTTPDTFRAHLRYYSAHYDLITPGDLESGRLPKRPLLITFDDAYRSVCEVAAPILHDAGAEALFFINPAAVLDRRVPTDNLLCFAATVLGEEEVANIVGCRSTPTPTLPQLCMDVAARLPERGRHCCSGSTTPTSSCMREVVFS